MIAALLFLSFAFFAVAQAGAVRNGGQSAADAAALAAAQDDRGALFDGFRDALGHGKTWEDWLDGRGPLTGDGCGEADYFAGRNRSDVLSCDAVTRNGYDGYTVRIQTRFSTGHTIVPGAGNRKAKATATAVIKPRCDMPDAAGHAKSIELTCDGGDFTIDPDSDSLDIEPSDLFSVVLVD